MPEGNTAEIENEEEIRGFQDVILEKASDIWENHKLKYIAGVTSIGSFIAQPPQSVTETATRFAISAGLVTLTTWMDSRENQNKKRHEQNMQRRQEEREKRSIG